VTAAPATRAPADEALAAALAAEHAAIFAYGPIGVRLGGDLAETARLAEAAHRQRRDDLLVLLTARGLAPASGAAGYALPFAVDGEPAALELAVLVEERVAGVWRAALPRVGRNDRAMVLDALIDAAVSATLWRRAAGIAPATVPFPGAP
jgi:hypothetical protein